MSETWNSVFYALVGGAFATFQVWRIEGIPNAFAAWGGALAVFLVGSLFYWLGKRAGKNAS